MPGTKCATHVFSSMLQSVIYMHGHCQCGNFHSGCQERKVISRYCKVCCPTLLVSSIPATVAAFIPGPRNEMCHTLILVCVAICYLDASPIPPWHPSLLVPGTKWMIQKLHSMWPWVIRFLYTCHYGCIVSWGQERNIPPTCSLLCCSWLFLYLTTNSVGPLILCYRNQIYYSDNITRVARHCWCPLYSRCGCFHSWCQERNVPHSYSLMCCSLLCVSLTTTYVAPCTHCTSNQI